MRRALAVLALSVLAGCMAEGGRPGDGSDPSSGALAFRSNCAGCHGTDARGGGPLAPGAPSLAGLAARNGGVFPAEHVVGVVEGHARQPSFSSTMPQFHGAGMGTGPVVEVPGVDRPVTAPLAGVLAYLQGLQD